MENLLHMQDEFDNKVVKWILSQFYAKNIQKVIGMGLQFIPASVPDNYVIEQVKTLTGHLREEYIGRFSR